MEDKILKYKKSSTEYFSWLLIRRVIFWDSGMLELLSLTVNIADHPAPTDVTNFATVGGNKAHSHVMAWCN